MTIYYPKKRGGRIGRLKKKWRKKGRRAGKREGGKGVWSANSQWMPVA